MSSISIQHRHLLRLAGILGLAATLFLACSELEPEAPSKEPLRVGVIAWPPFELFHFAYQERLFSPDQIELVEFDSLRNLISAFDEGRLHATVLSADLFIQNLEKDPGLRMILITDISDGGDALLARPDIDSLSDLRGARVGIESSHLGRFVLAHALEEADLNLEDVETVVRDENEHVNAFLAGDVDAVVTYDPMKARLLREGAVVLFDSSMMNGEIIDIVATRESVTRTHADELRVLARAFFEARARFFENPNAISKRLAPDMGITPTEFIDTLSGIRLADIHDNHHLLGGENPTLQDTLQKIALFMKQAGEIDSVPSFENALTVEFLPPHPPD